MEQSSGIALGLVLLALAGCSGGGESPEVGSAAPGGATEALICGLPVVQAPLSPPVDACRDGAVVFGPQRVTRAQGAPATEHLTFTLADGLPSCVAVTSSGDDGRHRVAAAFIWIDGQLVVDPGRFNQNVTTVEQSLQLAAGAHTLSIEVASQPGTFLDVSIKAGGSTQRHGLVTSEHLALFNLYAEPATFSPARAASMFFAQGTVLRFEGLPSGQQSFAVRWAFEVRSASSCVLVRTLSGEAVVGTPSSFATTAVWDGNDDSGAAVADGVYVYRLVAQLVATGPGGERVVDSLATAAQPVALDLTPPEVQIVRPADGDALNTQAVDVEISWSDPVVNGFASGLDLFSGQVLLDGTDVSGLLTLDGTGARGTLDLSSQPDGAHTLVASIADLVGNAGTAVSSFIVDTVPPVVRWSDPPDATDAAAVPLAYTLTDATSGLVMGSAFLLANGMEITAAAQCVPLGPDGIQTSECAGAYALEDGNWTLLAQVSDRAGNVGIASRDVTVDRTPPQIVLDPDINGLVTAADTVAVMGRLVDLLTTTLTVNGADVSVSGGAFSTQVALVDGPNTITLGAADALGHAASREVVVTRETKAPIVTSLKVHEHPLTCVATLPAEPQDVTVNVSDTMSPMLSVTYQNAGGGIDAAAIKLFVDGLEHSCVGRDTAASATELSCALDLAPLGHEIVLAIPDRTGSNIRRCRFIVTIDALPPVVADLDGPLAGAAVEIPTGALVEDSTAELIAAPSAATVGQVLAGEEWLVVGPAVDIVAVFTDDWKEKKGKIRITLPYDPAALATAAGDLLSEEEVRARFLDAGIWSDEGAGQWIINTVLNTVTYHTSHLSIRAAMVQNRRPAAATSATMLLNNGGPSAPHLVSWDLLNNGLVPAQSATFTAPLPWDDFVGLFPTAILADSIGVSEAVVAQAIAGYFSENRTGIEARATAGLRFIKGVKPRGASGFGVLYRTLWTLPSLPLTPFDSMLRQLGVSASMRATVVGALASQAFTVDVDEVAVVDVAGRVRGRVRLRVPDATTRSRKSDRTGPLLITWTSQQTIRDFAFSADGTRLYLVGDGSQGSVPSAGDGVYVADVPPSFASPNGELVVVGPPESAVAIGESAALAVSGNWGEDALFLVASGPRQWATADGPLTLSGATPSEVADALPSFGQGQMAAFGPYGGFEFTTLDDLRAVYKTYPCDAGTEQMDDDGRIAASLVYAGSLENVLLADLTAWADHCDDALISNGALVDLSGVDATRRARALMMAGLTARNPAQTDVVGPMLEAGQVLVLQHNSGAGARVQRVGTLALGNDPESPRPPPTVRAGLSDPMASVHVGEHGDVWVRQTVLSAERYAGAFSGDDERAVFWRSGRADSRVGWFSVSTTLPLAKAVEYSPRAAAHVFACPADEVTGMGCLGRSGLGRILSQDGEPKTGVVVARPDRSLVAVAPGVVGPPGPGSTLFLVNALGVSLPARTDDNRMVSAAIGSVVSYLGETPASIIGVAAVYDDDNDKNGVSPRSMIMRLTRTPTSAWSQAGTPVWGDEVDVGTEPFRFDAYGFIPRAPFAMLAPKVQPLESFALPRPRLASDIGSEPVFYVQEAKVGELRIEVRRLVTSGGHTSPPAMAVEKTSLAALQQELDLYNDPSTPGRSVAVVRVFLSAGNVTSEVVEPTGLRGQVTGDTAPTVVLRPEPVLLPKMIDPATGEPEPLSEKPDPRYTFLVVADQGGVHLVADCNDGSDKTRPLGAITEYGDGSYSGYLAPLQVTECAEDAAEICAHPVFPTFGILDQEGVQQAVYADLVVCGKAAAVPGYPADKLKQQSLASEPLRVVVDHTKPQAVAVVPSQRVHPGERLAIEMTEHVIGGTQAMFVCDGRTILAPVESVSYRTVFVRPSWQAVQDDTTIEVPTSERFDRACVLTGIEGATDLAGNKAEATAAATVSTRHGLEQAIRDALGIAEVDGGDESDDGLRAIGALVEWMKHENSDKASNGVMKRLEDLRAANNPIVAHDAAHTVQRFLAATAMRNQTWPALSARDALFAGVAAGVYFDAPDRGESAAVGADGYFQDERYLMPDDLVVDAAGLRVAYAAGGNMLTAVSVPQDEVWPVRFAFDPMQLASATQSAAGLSTHVTNTLLSYKAWLPIAPRALVHAMPVFANELVGRGLFEWVPASGDAAARFLPRQLGTRSCMDQSASARDAARAAFVPAVMDEDVADRVGDLTLAAAGCTTVMSEAEAQDAFLGLPDVLSPAFPTSRVPALCADVWTGGLVDADGDGFTACGAFPSCGDAALCTRPADCADGFAGLIAPADISPEAVEHPGVLVDYDCDGLAQPADYDTDRDGAPDAGWLAADNCLSIYNPMQTTHEGVTGDACNPALCFPTTEVCNGQDDDCDFSVDDGSDLDGDGFTVCGTMPNGGTNVAYVDCSDTDATVFPGAAEHCVDSVGNDCRSPWWPAPPPDTCEAEVNVLLCRDWGRRDCRAAFGATVSNAPLRVPLLSEVDGVPPHSGEVTCVEPAAVIFYTEKFFQGRTYAVHCTPERPAIIEGQNSRFAVGDASSMIVAWDRYTLPQDIEVPGDLQNPSLDDVLPQHLAVDMNLVAQVIVEQFRNAMSPTCGSLRAPVCLFTGCFLGDISPCFGEIAGSAGPIDVFWAQWPFFFAFGPDSYDPPPGMSLSGGPSEAVVVNHPPEDPDGFIHAGYGSDAFYVAPREWYDLDIIVVHVVLTIEIFVAHQELESVTADLWWFLHPYILNRSSPADAARKFATALWGYVLVTRDSLPGGLAASYAFDKLRFGIGEFEGMLGAGERLALTLPSSIELAADQALRDVLQINYDAGGLVINGLRDVHLTRAEPQPCNIFGLYGFDDCLHFQHVPPLLVLDRGRP